MLDTSEMNAIGNQGRETVSFAFIDLCGFTNFLETAGDEAAVKEVHLLRDTVREVTPLFGVRVEKWLGDGVMLVSVEPEALVGATVAIQLRFARVGHLNLRAGIATGPVLLFEGDDYVGRAVNLASRLADEAPPNEILAATDRLDLPGWVTAFPHVSVTLRGMTEPVSVVSVAANPSVLKHRSWTRTAAALGALIESLRSGHPTHTLQKT